MKEKTKIELEQLLNDLWEYMDSKSDADYDSEKQVPNEAMRFKGRIEELIYKIMVQELVAG